MRIAVFGTGYVGLVTAVGLANTGKEIICIEKDNEKINKIREGISPIYEPGLELLLRSNKGRITITSDAKQAILEAGIIIIAVGTPFDGQNIDLSFIEQAAGEIGDVIKVSDKYKIIVVKSTVIPGTTMNVVKPIVLNRSGKMDHEVGFAMNPEFLREGNAVEDFTQPDRIILGISSDKVEKPLREMYSGFITSDIIITNPGTAEMIKYTANSFLALTISYANEIARICEKLPGVDSEEVFNGVVLDKRFSPFVGGKRVIPQLATYLRAGIGFGGSCFPKDVKALQAFSKKMDIDGQLLSGLLYINKSQLEHVFKFGLDKFKGKVSRISILGTAFKPETDDIRESPGIKLIQMAVDNGIKVSVHDYIALQNTKKLFGGIIDYFENPLEAIRNADVVFVTTIWPQYKLISDNEFENNLEAGAILIDTRSHFKEREYTKWRYRIGVG